MAAGTDRGRFFACEARRVAGVAICPVEIFSSVALVAYSLNEVVISYARSASVRGAFALGAERGAIHAIDSHPDPAAGTVMARPYATLACVVKLVADHAR